MKVSARIMKTAKKKPKWEKPLEKRIALLDNFKFWYQIQKKQQL